jgi:hypothetical protein
MNRNLILLTILIVLAGFAWYLTKEKSSQKVVYIDRNFAIEHMDEVGKIILADHEGNRTEIERAGSSWLVNGTYGINDRRMETFSKTLTDLDIRYIPSQAESETAIKQLASYTNHCKIYDNQGDLLRSYFIGGTNADGMGTYMMMENSSSIFVMDIPYFQGAIDLRYDANPEYWMTEKVFSKLTENNIRSIELRFTKESANSLKLDQKGNSEWHIQPMFPNEMLLNKAQNVARVKSFVINLLDLKAGRITRSIPGESVEETKSRQPEVLVNITGQDSIVHEFFIYQALRRNQQGEIIEGQTELYSPRQVMPTYYILAPNDFWYSVSFTKLNNILKSLDYFYDEDTN